MSGDVSVGESVMNWWDIKKRDPIVVAGLADYMAEEATSAILEEKETGFSAPLSYQQRDDLAWNARWDASGAYTMATMVYRLLHETRRLWWAVLGLSAFNTALLILLLRACLRA